MTAATAARGARRFARELTARCTSILIAMAVRISVVLLVCAVVALVVFAPATARPAAACYMLEFSLEAVAEEAEIVIVGEVVRERTIERVKPSREAYESTVDVRAALKGNPERELILSPLGYLNSDCSGGPRLTVGERVLLFLSRVKGELKVYGHEYGKYLLANGFASSIWADEPIRFDNALPRVAAIIGATDEQLYAALDFARVGLTPALQPDAETIPTDALQSDAEPLPVDVEEDGGQPALLIALASALLALLVAAMAGLGLRRAR